MAFFSGMGLGGTPSAFSGLGGGGMGGGAPSAFSSPAMDPMTLALLLRMQNAGVGGGSMGNMAPTMPQANPPPAGGGINPMMLGGLGGAAGAGLPPGAGAAPGGGAGLAGLS